jgi:propanol-preferring alcohol dehydrogenase
VTSGELAQPKLPLIPGHQVVGRVVKTGPDAQKLRVGQIVGLPWLGGACGQCGYCLSGRENLCPLAEFTGYQKDGGMAEYCLADEEFCLPLPESLSGPQAAPLLCAGLIGYRALRMAGEARTLGFYGFGSAAHILTQVARSRDQQVFALTRPGDLASQEFALKLGATWAGGSDQDLPVALDAAILFAPDGTLVPLALKAVKPGGRVVCAGIHMSDIPSFPYRLLWGERSLLSVANLTRKDGFDFLQLAPKIPIQTKVTVYPLLKANEALEDLKSGLIQGSAVLAI